MSFFDSLSGSSQRRDMRNGFQESSRWMGAARRNVKDYNTSAKGHLTNYLTPYAERESQAGQLYGNAIGVNGNEAQTHYWDNYQADPQRAFDEGRAADTVYNAMSARGMSRSGLGALAASRASQEMGRSYTQDRLDRLAGLGGGQFANVLAGGLAGIDQSTGSQLAGLNTQQAQNAQGFHQGLANTRNMGVNNALAAGGLLVGGFSPTANGQSAFGNMARSANRLWS